MGVSSARAHAPLAYGASFTKHKFEDEIIEGFQGGHSRALNQELGSSERGAGSVHQRGA